MKIFHPFPYATWHPSFLSIISLILPQHREDNLKAIRESLLNRCTPSSPTAYFFTRRDSRPARSPVRRPFGHWDVSLTGDALHFILSATAVVFSWLKFQYVSTDVCASLSPPVFMCVQRSSRLAVLWERRGRVSRPGHTVSRIFTGFTPGACQPGGVSAKTLSLLPGYYDPVGTSNGRSSTEQPHTFSGFFKDTVFWSVWGNNSWTRAVAEILAVGSRATGFTSGGWGIHDNVNVPLWYFWCVLVSIFI